MDCPGCNAKIKKNTNVVAHKCGADDIIYDKDLSQEDLILKMKQNRKNGYSHIMINIEPEPINTDT